MLKQNNVMDMSSCQHNIVLIQSTQYCFVFSIRKNKTFDMVSKDSFKITRKKGLLKYKIIKQRFHYFLTFT